MNKLDSSSAEQTFRDAFDRLKRNEPNLLAKGTKVSQNNVAKEAGRDPSALKKSRYPLLIDEIKGWVHLNRVVTEASPKKLSPQKKKRVRALLERIAALKTQHDHSMSLLIEANAKIVDLTVENARLTGQIQKSNISELKPR